MYRPFHPCRRQSAAALRSFSGRTVTPSSASAPVEGVTTTFATATVGSLACLVPSHGTETKVLARLAGGTASRRAVRPLSTGQSVQAAEMTVSRTSTPVARFALSGGVRFSAYNTPVTKHPAASRSLPLLSVPASPAVTR